MKRTGAIGAGTVAAALLLAGCSAPTPTPTSTSTSPVKRQSVDVVTGLQSPWSILQLDGGRILVSERDSGRIVRVDRGRVEPIGTVPGVVHAGEGGLLGLAFRDGWLYAYETTADDNRVVRMRLSDDLHLGAPEVVLKGLHKAANHDGGRIAFGPDDLLYITVGDAGDPANAHDLNSLNGKILRMTPDGKVPSGNPFPGSYVYSSGHRNPQGLAWDPDGQLWAAEFGQDTWDELNRIEPGKDYGWPVVEGRADDRRFVDPVAQWSTDDASPSGLTYADGALWMAGLGGERLWRIGIASDGTATVTTSLMGEDGFGRLRDVARSADGLLVLTDNTDGRGTPRDGDDRLVRLPRAAG
jgi:glucose/arabinose dehydrogenase